MINGKEPARPILALNVTLAVVMSSLIIVFGVGGLWVLYVSKVVNASPEETAWITSQRPSSAANATLLDDTTIVSLSRGRCYWPCPEYDVSVFGSGRVTFRGHALVCERSPPDVLVDPTAVAKLVEGLKVGGFEKLRNYVQEDMTDAHTSTLALVRGEIQHSVEHYHGDQSAPRVLAMMEERVDEVAGTGRWLPIWKGSEAVCQLADGTTRPLLEPAVDRGP